MIKSVPYDSSWPARFETEAAFNRDIHWRRAYCWRNDRTLGTQHHQQMTQRGPQAAPITLNRSGAAAAKKVLVQELGDDCLVDTLNAQTAAVNPLGEVGNAANAVGEGSRRVAAVGQVLLERINVRRERPLREPVDATESRESDVTHGGLLKWGPPLHSAAETMSSSTLTDPAKCRATPALTTAYSCELRIVANCA